MKLCHPQEVLSVCNGGGGHASHSLRKDDLMCRARVRRPVPCWALVVGFVNRQEGMLLLAFFYGEEAEAQDGGATRPRSLGC